MSRSSRRRLSVKRETLRRLAAGELTQAAGGLVGVRCTDNRSGCQGIPDFTYYCDDKSALCPDKS